MPKVQSYVYDKIKAPMEEVKSEYNIDLDVYGFEMVDYTVSVTFMGQSNGDPTPIPAAYVEKLTNDIKTTYGDAYFQNITYTGFEKVNTSLAAKYLDIVKDGSKYDTIFKYTVTMNVRPGSDEENANTISLDLNGDQGAAEEVTE